MEAELLNKGDHPVKVRARAVALRDESANSFGAAEFIEHKNMLAIHGCMDRSTGALARAYTETSSMNTWRLSSATRFPSAFCSCSSISSTT